MKNKFIRNDMQDYGPITTASSNASGRLKVGVGFSEVKKKHLKKLIRDIKMARVELAI